MAEAPVTIARSDALEAELKGAEIVGLTREEEDYCTMGSVVSFVKGLLLVNEAGGISKATERSPLPTLFTLYAGVFQLGISHFLVQPLSTDFDMLRNAVRKSRDVARVVQRRHLTRHFEELATIDRVNRTGNAFRELSGLRDDMQYGPRLRGSEDGFLLDSCKNSAEHVANRVGYHLGVWTGFFDDVVGDLHRRHSLPHMVVLHSDFLLSDPSGLGRYYSTEAQDGAKRYVQALRSRLYPNAH